MPVEGGKEHTRARSGEDVVKIINAIRSFHKLINPLTGTRTRTSGGTAGRDTKKDNGSR